KCYKTLECKQYNAFSPYCCDGVPVDAVRSGHPLLGHPLFGSPAAVFSLPGDADGLSQLPSAGGMTWDSSLAPPIVGTPAPSNPAGSATVHSYPLTTGTAPQGTSGTVPNPAFNTRSMPSYKPGF